MPKKIKCAKCGRKLISLKGGSVTSHGDNQIKISDVGGKRVSTIVCPDPACGQSTLAI